MSNRAACYIMDLEFDLAIKDCRKAILLDPEYIKSYTRMGRIYLLFGQLEESLIWYKRALKIIQANNSEIDPDIVRGLQLVNISDIN